MPSTSFTLINQTDNSNPTMHLFKSKQQPVQAEAKKATMAAARKVELRRSLRDQPLLGGVRPSEYDGHESNNTATTHDHNESCNAFDDGFDNNSSSPTSRKKVACRVSGNAAKPPSSAMQPKHTSPQLKKFRGECEADVAPLHLTDNPNKVYRLDNAKGGDSCDDSDFPSADEKKPLDYGTLQVSFHLYIT